MLSQMVGWRNLTGYLKINLLIIYCKIVKNRITSVTLKKVIEFVENALELAQHIKTKTETRSFSTFKPKSTEQSYPPGEPDFG